jgi:hypothetical protein
VLGRQRIGSLPEHLQIAEAWPAIRVPDDPSLSHTPVRFQCVWAWPQLQWLHGGRQRPDVDMDKRVVEMVCIELLGLEWWKEGAANK